MAGINIPGLSAGVTSNKVKEGVGYVHQRTVEIGDTVIAMENIGSMVLIDGQRTYGRAWLGAILIVFAINKSPTSLPGAIALLAGIALIVWNFMRPVEMFLSIGTADGRRTDIVSTKKEFLKQTLTALRDKLDRNDVVSTGTINISGSTFQVTSGTLVVGHHNMAGGAGSELEYEGR